MFNVVQQGLEAENAAHYSFCGPPKVADLAPATLVLHFAGQPENNSLASSFKAISEQIASLPENVAKSLTDSISSGEGFDDSPEGLAVEALYRVSAALKAAVSNKRSPLLESEPAGSDNKKAKTNGVGDE